MMAEPLTFDFTKPITRAEKFLQFHEANPQVFQMLEMLAAKLVARGRKKIGIGLLTEVLRWEYYMVTDDPNSEWKLNNNLRAYYARLLVEKHPEWESVFELRQQRST